LKLPVSPPVEPMLAKLTPEIPEGDGWLYEPKWDGFRTLVFRDGDEVYLQSRDSKPMGRYFPELEARMRALLRRARPSAPVDRDMGRLQFEREARRASVDGVMLDLSPREWLLLDLLLMQRNRVVTKDQILRAWSSDKGDAARPEAAGGSGSGTVEVYIHRLRRKLEGSGLGIRTVRGLGYLLEAEAAAR